MDLGRRDFHNLSNSLDFSGKNFAAFQWKENGMLLPDQENMGGL